jgi:hypothetical protein
LFGINDIEAARLIQSSADNGFPCAQCAFGRCLLNGTGVTRNESVAVRYFERAGNHRIAQCELGKCLIAGIGIEKNISQAFSTFAASAAQNYDERQFFYGHCFENGFGIAQDPSSAVQNDRLAAQQRHIPSLCRVGVCLVKGFGVRQNVNQAASLSADAGAQGFLSALYYRGHSFQFRRGITEKLTEAIQSYRAAVPRDDWSAFTALGLCFSSLNSRGRCQIQSVRKQFHSRSSCCCSIVAPIPSIHFSPFICYPAIGL